MAWYSGLSGKNTIFTHYRTSWYAGTSGNSCIFTNIYIVSNLHMIIENYTIFNNGIAEGSSVYSGAGTDFYSLTYNDST